MWACTGLLCMEKRLFRAEFLISAKKKALVLETRTACNFSSAMLQPVMLKNHLQRSSRCAACPCMAAAADHK